MDYKNRIIAFPKTVSFFLIGVRGSGKTALLKRLFPNALYIDLLDEALYQSYLANVSLFYEKISAFKKDGLVIVDEIQRMPRLLNEVHRLIESTSQRFILTGSSVRKIKKAGVNLLAGRAGMIHLHPFVPEELGSDFNLAMALRYGLLPVIYSSSDREFSLKAYGQTYLKEEIKAEALVRNLPGFTRFLEIAGLYHGQTVNMSAIARECQISRDAVRDFFSILEDTMLGFFLSAYTPKLRLRERKHRKFYFIDPGLVRTLKKNCGPVHTEEKGTLFEGLIALILKAYGDYFSLFKNMYYWVPAEARKTEVDFLLEVDRGLIAIEVKSNTQVSSKDYKGLKAIGKLSSVKKRILIYLGKDIRKTKEGIEIWPFDTFYKSIRNKNLII